MFEQMRLRPRAIVLAGNINITFHFHRKYLTYFLCTVGIEYYLVVPRCSEMQIVPQVLCLELGFSNHCSKDLFGIWLFSEVVISWSFNVITLWQIWSKSCRWQITLYLEVLSSFSQVSETFLLYRIRYSQQSWPLYMDKYMSSYAYMLSLK